MPKTVLVAMLLAALLDAPACSSADEAPSTEGDDFESCEMGSSACAGGATSFSCAPGVNPEDEDTTAFCGQPVSETAAEDDFCCFLDFPSSASACQPDGLEASFPCASGSYAFACAAGDSDPSAFDARLVCSSSGTTDPATGERGFCCTYAAVATGDDTDFPSGCSPDAAVDSACDGNSTGYSCAAGDNPESTDATVICSQPVADGANDDFCCTTSGFTAGSCTPDDSVSDACADGTYGFTCDAGDTDPSTQDANLADCSPPADGGGANLYCCTYN